MIYGPPRIYPIFDPTGPKMGKTSQKKFCNNNISSDTIFKKKLFELRKDTF